MINIKNMKYCELIGDEDMLFDKFNIQFNQDNIFRMLQCEKNSDMYDIFLEEYKKVKDNVYLNIKAKAVLEFGEMPEKDNKKKEESKKFLFALFTVGEKITEYIELLFAENKYIQGLIVNIMADDYLFQMDQVLKEEIKKIGMKNNIHIKQRLEAPCGISMEAQKVAYDVCNAKEKLNLRINESYMFDPIKTLCVIYEIADGIGAFDLDHECKKCNKIDCPIREYNEIVIKVLLNEKIQEIRYRGGESLLECLRTKEIYLPAVCGGISICGNCKIQFLEGKPERTDADIKYFTEIELEQGYRLACKSYPDEDCMITIDQKEDKIEVLVSQEEEEDPLCGEYGIAIDIGTTTVAMALLSLENGKVVDHYMSVNHQRTYGADVISRILASNNGKNLELQSIILKDLFIGIKKLTNSFSKRVKQIIIAGNTTMVHLLMNYSCNGLGEYPFISENLEPVFLTGIEMFKMISDYDSIFKNNNFEVIIFPGISAFIGGDILSGLYFIDFESKKGINLFVDLGTNGELVIGNKKHILCTSTAVGTAFEGGNLSSGVASVPGAIHKIDINHAIRVQTIHQKDPIGICGTGMIDGIAELLKLGLIDETGLLEEAYFDEGYNVAKDKNGKNIKITQKDIREIQLAKAAIAAGIETMIEEFGVTYSEIKYIYIAGGFGYQLDIIKAKKIGILPSNIKAEINAIGNSALHGAIKLLQFEKRKQKSELEKIEKIKSNIKEFNLAENDRFNERYIEQMYFKVW